MSAKPRIQQNAWDNWYGYYGNRRILAFFNSIAGYGAEQEAELWAAEKTLQRDPAILLGKAIARLKSSHWCDAGDREAMRLLKDARTRVNTAEFNARVHAAMVRL